MLLKNIIHFCRHGVTEYIKYKPVSCTTSAITQQIFSVVFPHCFSKFIPLCITESSALIEILGVASMVHISTWNVDDICWVNIGIYLLEPLFSSIVNANKIMQSTASYHNFCTAINGCKNMEIK
jgi:hypothetical protein